MLHHGDCREIMATLPPASIDAIVTDPPYGLTSVSRGGSPRQFVDNPYGRSRVGTDRGGFMGKTWDGCGIERDPVVWSEAYRVLKPGSLLVSFGGTRTAHRITCAIEDAGFEIRDTLCWLYGSGFPKSRGLLKPAYEPIILARKPAPRMTPLNIEACRIGDEPIAGGNGSLGAHGVYGAMRRDPDTATVNIGRWPANVVHDGLDESWARYFYCAKSSRSERNAGLDGMPNGHPTVKPLKLMQWLCRLVCPPNGTILDPFLGSGTTGCAAALEGFAFVGIEQDAEYLEIARRRIDHWTPIIARAAD